MYANFETTADLCRQQPPIDRNESKTLIVMIAGLGGLGVVSLAQKISRQIGRRYAHVHTLEQRGVAQRRSSTSAVITASTAYIAPAWNHRGVDLLLALEPLEALRHAPLVKDNGLCFMSDLRVETICGGDSKYRYPGNAEILQAIRDRNISCASVPLTGWLGRQQLLPVHASSVMLGLAGACLDFDCRNLKMDQKNALAYEWGADQYRAFLGTEQKQPRADRVDRNAHAFPGTMTAREKLA